MFQNIKNFKDIKTVRNIIFFKTARNVIEKLNGQKNSLKHQKKIKKIQTFQKCQNILIGQHLKNYNFQKYQIFQTVKNVIF